MEERKFKKYQHDGPGDEPEGPGAEGPIKKHYEIRTVLEDLKKATQGKRGKADQYKTTPGE